MDVTEAVLFFVEEVIAMSVMGFSLIEMSGSGVPV
jgi:hypothetical protein